MQKWIVMVIAACGLGALVLTHGPTPATAEDQAAKEAAPPAREVDLKVIADPSHEKMNQTAPDVYEALFKTTKGAFTVKVTRQWAPAGADRFYNLVNNGYYDGNRFFRVVPKFVVQWGIHGDKDVNKAWYDEANAKAVNLKDDERKKSNLRGRITFANAGPNTRSTQLFINLGNNDFLDDKVKMRGAIFAPFGEIDAKGMLVVDQLYSGYGEPPRSLQGILAEKGNSILDEYFPKLDGIITATIVEPKEGEKAGE